jgi:hypothetical protein
MAAKGRVWSCFRTSMAEGTGFRDWRSRIVSCKVAMALRPNGMRLERFLWCAASLHRDFTLPVAQGRSVMTDLRLG